MLKKTVYDRLPSAYVSIETCCMMVSNQVLASARSLSESPWLLRPAESTIPSLCHLTHLSGTSAGAL